jgi:hypothetical protein
MSNNSNSSEKHTQKLFDDRNIKSVKNQAELDELLKQVNLEKQQKQGPLSKYDPLYVCLASRVDFEKERQWIESMWMEYQEAKLADRNFASAFKVQCYQRTWELYLGITLHKKWGLQSGSKSKRESGGPDFKTIHNANGVTQTVWIEATVATKGDSSDRVPEMEFGKVGDLPEDKMLLRLTTRLDAKYKEYCSYVKQGIIGTNDPYIVAINRSALQYLDAQIPLILKCLFRLEHQALFIKSKKSGLKATESFWTTRDHIAKEKRSDPEEIPMDFFDDPGHSGISAIIYVETDIINSPALPEEMGDNFTIVLNPYAKNPLPEELLIFGNIWKKEEGYIFASDTPKIPRM